MSAKISAHTTGTDGELKPRTDAEEVKKGSRGERPLPLTQLRIKLLDVSILGSRTVEKALPLRHQHEDQKKLADGFGRHRE